MSELKFSDLHCHPAGMPLNHKKDTLWDTFLGFKLKRVFRKQKKGKRGGIYDQSGYPKLLTGKVKLVFASLYPLEQGFMVNNSKLFSIFNFTGRLGPLSLLGFNPFGKNGHLRDYFTSIFTKFQPKRIRQLKTEEYWDSFRQELEMYRNENEQPGEVSANNEKEIKSLLKLYKKTAPEFKKNGSYVVADKTWAKDLPQDDKILTVLTMEGMGIVSQTKKGAPNSRHGTYLLDETTIFNRIDYLKRHTPIFFITFSHHFSTELCGHARGLPNFSRNLGFLDQEFFINEGFSRLGYRVMLQLLSVKLENGKWKKDISEENRRILIDVKHMSLKGRMTLYQVIQGYNKAFPDEKIPIVASHVGYSNKSMAQMLYTIRTQGEKDSTQTDEIRIHEREHIFNSWSLNLGLEEIGIIVDSGGLIGLSMEQNNLGVGFGKKIKTKNKTYITRLIMNQLLSMAKASNSAKFWNCITLGTDYDGLIDPVDRYSSGIFFTRLRQDLKDEFIKLSLNELKEAFLIGANEEPSKHEIVAIIDEMFNKFFFDNSYEFVKKHLNPDHLPLFKKQRP